jgi:hypothetical protein
MPAKSVINMIRLLLPTSDWPIIRIGWGALLLVVSHLVFTVPVLWAGLEKGMYLNLAVRYIIFAGSQTEHCWRCSNGYVTIWGYGWFITHHLYSTKALPTTWQEALSLRESRTVSRDVSHIREHPNKRSWHICKAFFSSSAVVENVVCKLQTSIRLSTTRMPSC